MFTNNTTEITRPLHELSFEQKWNKSSTHSAKEMVAYTLARALRYESNEKRIEGDEDPIQWATRRLKLAMPPVTSSSKLANGRRPYDTLLGIVYAASQGRIADGALELSNENLSRCAEIAEKAFLEIRASR